MENFNANKSPEKAELLHEAKREIQLVQGRLESILDRIDSVSTEQLTLIMEMATGANKSIEAVAARPEWMDVLRADHA